MKTTAAGSSNKNTNTSGLLIFLLTIALVISSGCIDEQEGLKISGNDMDAVYFGFDLRPGPKEDARIYAPFLHME